MADVPASVAAHDLSFIPEEALHEWVLAQRWFGSKARGVGSLNVLEAIPLRAEAPLLVLAIVEARFQTGTHEIYQLPLGLSQDAAVAEELVIGQVDGWTVFDALADPDLGRALLDLMKAERETPVEGGRLRFGWLDGDAPAEDAPVRLMDVEQSNSSVVFGDQLVFKVFRRLEPGVNPELELLRFLTQREFPNIAALAGWYEYDGRLMDSTLGIAQAFLANGRDGWEYALEDPEGLLGELGALGRVTGEMHTILGSERSDLAFAPEEPSTEALSLLTATVDEQIDRIFVDLPEDDRVEPIAGRGQDVRERLGILSSISAGGQIIRTHGDYHLGQTMLTDAGWAILDFEGEPARSLPERRRKQSPLRDVAGMLRSFAYAASASEILRGVPSPEGWEQRARDAFLGRYFEAVDPRLLPPGQDPTQRLLLVFELEKAVYELRYELNNRPDWVGIPVAGIARLLEAA